MNTEIDKFLRIGTDYFMIDNMPTIKGEAKEHIIKWKRSTIVDDYGIKSLKEIVKYKSFCTVPSHTNFQQEIDSHYNEYQKVAHRLKQGNFDNTKKFLFHIFGDQYELGLDYLGIIWHYPSQMLPILSLVSNERSTGKTTFLNWVKALFEGNMTINKNEDFRSQFNSDWANKLIVAIDEVLLDKKEDSEMLKNLSTAKHYKKELKGKDKYEIEFFGKFILCSNNVDSFVKIDQEEIRYWIRNIPSIKSEDPFMFKKIIKEIPHFLYFINDRTIVSQNKSRMWFTKEQIWTKDLDILKKGNKTFNEKQLIESINDELDMFELKEIRFSVGDLVNLMRNNNLRISGHQITTLLTEKWKLKSVNGRYKKYSMLMSFNIDTSTVESMSVKGRYYSFTKEILKRIQY